MIQNTTHTVVNVEGRDSLDIEVAQKTAMTVAALTGKARFPVFHKHDLPVHPDDLIKSQIPEEFC